MSVISYVILPPLRPHRNLRLYPDLTQHSRSVGLQVWLGGSPGNTRTAYNYVERMKDPKMEELVEPILR